MKPLLGMAPLIWAVGLGAGAVAGIAYAALRKRPSQEVRERRRRLEVSSTGRMAAGTILELRGNELLYSYTVRGVEYTAAQDISELRAKVPEDIIALAGPATVKYQAVNPANSIVLSEDWTGLRGPQIPPAKP